MAAVDTSRIKQKDGRDYIAVIRGDTLSEIAEAYIDLKKLNKDTYAYVKDLAALNKISDPDIIVVGQIIYFTKATTSTPSSSGKQHKRVNVTQFGLVANGQKNELYAAWDWFAREDGTPYTPAECTGYDIEWKTFEWGIPKWSDTTETRNVTTFTIPENASKVQFRIKPISGTYETTEKNWLGKSTTTTKEYFSDAEWTDWVDNEYKQDVRIKIDVPSGLNVELDGLSLTAKVDNPGTDKATLVKFQLVEDENLNNATQNRATVTEDTIHVSTTFTVKEGHKYTVRACANKDGIDSDWTNFASSVETRPATPKINKVTVKSKSEISLEWSSSPTATGYTIEYTTDDFYNGAEINSVSINNDEAVNSNTVTSYVIRNLIAGKTYKFRVKAVKGSESSGWSDTKDATIGSTPTAPTTWSSTTTAMSDEGESVVLYWVHNSTDESTQESATIKLDVEGVENLSLVLDDVSVERGDLREKKASTLYYKVEYDSSKKTYTETDKTVSVSSGAGTPVDGALTDWDKQVYVATIGGVKTYYSIHQILTYSVDAAKDEVSDENDNKDPADSESNRTHSLTINTRNYGNAKFVWNVITTTTAGKSSESSADRLVEIFEKPEVTMKVFGSENTTTGITYYKVDYLENSDVYVQTPETLDSPEGEPVAGIFTVTNKQVWSVVINGVETFYCKVEGASSSINSLPIRVEVEVETDEKIQKPIEYMVTIIANETHKTVDNTGNDQVIFAGDSICTKYYDATNIEKLDASISASDITLVNGQTYTVKCLVSMSSGITVEVYSEIYISWTSVGYSLNADIEYYPDSYSLSIRPYCETGHATYYQVRQVGKLYQLNKEITYNPEDVSGSPRYYAGISPQKPVLTTTGEQVWGGYAYDIGDILYAVETTSTPYTDVQLSVYRREYDGGFIPIVEDIDGSLESTVTDPHPSLDYARYRIVAKDTNTTRITYRDLPNYPIGEKAILIQWDEPNIPFYATESTPADQYNSGSIVRLPYNINLTVKKNLDTTLVEYIGRKHPVSYYGTQVGETATLSTVIPKNDVETIYALQRLQGYFGDVYIREPHGVGYWANISVSFPRTYLEVVIPVSIDITRVEGGA